MAENGEKAPGIEMLDRPNAGSHAERPGQGGDRLPECQDREFDGMRADARLPGARPERPIRSMTPGSWKARVGFRIARPEPETSLRE
ncbi:MAG: hypothetical protein F4186_13750 [Boseongicola sp. SB0676_bin_33]|nr:hypothetical protein [Boseongicola sp. SB0676_bin_33]MYK31168.1 hypothetical protein [Boseongicola sp. SB0670_bin_30]